MEPVRAASGRTDMPLTPAGEAAARGVAERLKGLSFSAVWSSPSQRAYNTSVLAGFGAQSVRNDDLQEWTTAPMKGAPPRKSWPSGRAGTFFATAARKAKWRPCRARADRIIRQLRDAGGSILIFSSAHFLRVLTARWLGLAPEGGALFVLDTASISVLGYEHDLSEPVVRKWNQA